MPVTIPTPTRSSSPPRARPRAKLEARERHHHRQAAIERLGEPLVPALLRLTPSVAVTTSRTGRLPDRSPHPRCRGQPHLALHRRHRAQRPGFSRHRRASSCSTPTSPRASRWSVARNRPCGARRRSGASLPSTAPTMRQAMRATAEAGSFGFERASASEHCTGRASLAAAVGWQRATGIDSFSGAGDKDGYRNLSGRLRGTFAAGPSVRLGVAAIALTGRTEFDGYDPVTFDHADTLDNSRNHLVAGRVWTEFGRCVTLGGRGRRLLLGSSNRNFLADVGKTGPGALAESCRRPNRAPLRAGPFRPSTDPRRGRRARDLPCPRHDLRRFDRAGPSREHRPLRPSGVAKLDASWRLCVAPRPLQPFCGRNLAAGLATGGVDGGFALAGSYAEGIAQPTFFDLYGFFPGNFVGNPTLKPESSRGFEARFAFAARRSGLADRLSAAASRRDRR